MLEGRLSETEAQLTQLQQQTIVAAALETAARQATSVEECEFACFRVFVHRHFCVLFAMWRQQEKSLLFACNEARALGDCKRARRTA